ncbi:MAG: adenine phosphoribosyltransferase [Tissierellia bacterium]|nr:adenine phosphoribosyltransferase [Tissierellia bacterium]
MNFKEVIASIEDYPVEGVVFRDITPLLGDYESFRSAIDQMAQMAKAMDIDMVVGIEARGFILGSPLALELGCGFVPIRKPGKLPREVHSEDYDLEYGTNSVEVHTDAIRRGQRVLIVDDLLATGGTAQAAARLFEKMGAQIQGFCFLIELEDLAGREKLAGYPVKSVVKY